MQPPTPPPRAAPGRSEQATILEVRDLTMAYGPMVIQRDLSFGIRAGEVFVIMGGSGCGKSTLLRHLTGLHAPASGEVRYRGTSLWDLEPAARERLMRRFGVLYQSGALFSSMTVAENVALPLMEYTELSRAEIQEIVALKLALVGLADSGAYSPAELSGGMRKRAGLARAMALDPEILFFDEPSAGLDPLSARRLDELILELRQSLGATIVVVTHELASIFAIGDRAVFLDRETRTAVAVGPPAELRDHDPHEVVRSFLRRGETVEEPR